MGAGWEKGIFLLLGAPSSAIPTENKMPGKWEKKGSRSRKSPNLSSKSNRSAEDVPKFPLDGKGKIQSRGSREKLGSHPERDLGTFQREKPRTGMIPKLQIPIPNPGFPWNKGPGAAGFIDIPDQRNSGGNGSGVHGCGKENVGLGIIPGEILALNPPWMGGTARG